MLKRLLCTAVVMALGTLPVTASEEESEYGLLVDKPGAEETFIYCTACHSERIVAQQGLSRADWKALFVWMEDEQEMEPIEEPDNSIIIDYLSEHYNTDRPNFPKR